MSDSPLVPYSDLHPLREGQGTLTPIQQVAFEMFVMGDLLASESQVRPHVLLQYYGGLETLGPRGLQLAIRTFREINDPHSQVELVGGDIFDWRIEGERGYVGTIANIGEPLRVTTDGLHVNNVAVLPAFAYTSGAWHDGKGNIAPSGYDPASEYRHAIDPLLLTHKDEGMHNALLAAQEAICALTLEVAAPLAGIRVNGVIGGGEMTLWGYSGPLQPPIPDFTSLPAGAIVVGDLRGKPIGEGYFGTRYHPDIKGSVQELFEVVKRVIGNHLTTPTIEQMFVPSKGMLGRVLRTGDYRDVQIPSPLDQLLSACAGLQDTFLNLGIDEITSAAAAYSWYLGVACAAKKMGVNIETT